MIGFRSIQTIEVVPVITANKSKLATEFLTRFQLFSVIKIQFELGEETENVSL